MPGEPPQGVRQTDERRRATVNILRKVVTAGVALLAAAALVACGAGALHSEQEASAATVVGAEELFAAYQKDEAAADELYKGKLLRVSGLVDYVGTDLVLDAPQVILSGAAKDKARGVDCAFDTRYEKQVAKIEQGDKVTVLGTCEGSYKYNVLLRDCEPVEE